MNRMFQLQRSGVNSKRTLVDGRRKRDEYSEYVNKEDFMRQLEVDSEKMRMRLNLNKK